LGERAQFAWWPTAFYEASSRTFLEPVFARTWRLAQYHGVLEAARRLHDEHLSVGSYHLFRLPEEIEQDLHAIAQGGQGDSLAMQMPETKEAALHALQGLAAATVQSAVGPTAVGSIAALSAPATLRAIAAAYRTAFHHNTRIFPYLVA
jgi:hypothetical protein